MSKTFRVMYPAGSLIRYLCGEAWLVCPTTRLLVRLHRVA